MDQDEGISPIGAYELVVHAYVEGLYAGRSFCKVKGKFRKMHLTGYDDGDITAPTDQEDKENRPNEMRVQAEVHRRQVRNRYPVRNQSIPRPFSGLHPH